MAHQIESISGTAMSALLVRGKANGGTKSAAPVYARFTKLGGFNGGGGIRIKVRRVADDSGLGPVDIQGEDLYALREFLNELPEAAFVRPADPVEVPPRWADGDILEEHWPSGTLHAIWVRKDGRWHKPDGTITVSDGSISAGLSGGYTTSMSIVRQASGQDL